uniref:Uncharacterized protein n=1 Tax=Ciona savignyi TaxID=51511 RepID=H2YKW2_CIOSA
MKVMQKQTVITEDQELMRKEQNLLTVLLKKLIFPVVQIGTDHGHGRLIAVDSVGHMMMREPIEIAPQSEEEDQEVGREHSGREREKVQGSIPVTRSIIKGLPTLIRENEYIPLANAVCRAPILPMMMS